MVCWLILHSHKTTSLPETLTVSLHEPLLRGSWRLTVMHHITCFRWRNVLVITACNIQYGTPMTCLRNSVFFLFLCEGCPMVLCSVPTSIPLSQVTLAVLEISMDNFPYHPCGKVSWYTGVYTGSPGIILVLPHPQYSCGRVSQNARVTQAVLGLSWDHLPPSTTVAEYTGVIPAVPRFSWDSLLP